MHSTCTRQIPSTCEGRTSLTRECRSATTICMSEMLEMLQLAYHALKLCVACYPVSTLVLEYLV